MATYNLMGISPMPMVAGGAILPFRCVKLDSVTNQVVATSAITDVVMGTNYLGNTLASGDQIAVQGGGIAKMVAGAAVALGAEVMPAADGAGKVITSAGATARSCGVALTAATADGDIIEVRMGAPNLGGVANS